MSADALNYITSPLFDPAPDGVSRGALQILIEEAGFCDCGRPEDATRELHGLLMALDVRRRIWRSERWSHSQFGKPQQDSRLDYINGFLREQSYLTWYWLDHLGLEEHGGAAPGWLTPKGEMILALLDCVRETVPRPSDEGASSEE